MKPADKNEFRAQIAKQFSEVLNEKGLEWVKEWHGIGGDAQQNGISRRCYTGLNQFWLTILSMSKGYSDPRWYTMNQIMDKSGKYHKGQHWHLQKGSKATYVEYWYPYDLKNKKPLTWEQYKEALKTRKENEFTLFSTYTPVFNGSQIDGLPEMPHTENTGIETDCLIERLQKGMNIEIKNDGGDRAYYSPTEDMIHLPTAESFTSTYAYNATALHELAHSTGHESRLNREFGTAFNLPQYAYEELVAEMTAAFMGIGLSVESCPEYIENHKAYVQSWVNAINDKPEALTKALKDAADATAYMEKAAGLSA